LIGANNISAVPPDGFFNTRRDTFSWLNQISLTPAQELLVGADFERDAIGARLSFVASQRQAGHDAAAMPGPYEITF
jgi:hypothetical protein